MPEDEGKLRQEMQRGEEAKRILEHPMVSQAFADLEAHLTKEWAQSEAKDAKGREQTWQCLKALSQFRKWFENHVQTGKMASTRFEELKRRVQRL